MFGGGARRRRPALRRMRRNWRLAPYVLQATRHRPRQAVWGLELRRISRKHFPYYRRGVPSLQSGQVLGFHGPQVLACSSKPDSTYVTVLWHRSRLITSACIRMQHHARTAATGLAFLLSIMYKQLVPRAHSGKS